MLAKDFKKFLGSLNNHQIELLASSRTRLKSP